MNGSIERMRASITMYPGVVDAAFYDWTNEGEGKQLVLRFGNDYGLSICSENAPNHMRSYANDANNTWEVGICKFFGDDIDDWKLQDVSVNPNSPHTNDTSVYGWQNAEQIENLIRVWSAFEG